MKNKFYSILINGMTAFRTCAKSRAFEIARFLAKAQHAKAEVTDGFSVWEVAL